MDEDKYTLIWNIQYAMRFGRRQNKLLERIARGIKVTTLVVGGAAFGATFSEYPSLTLLTATLAAIDAVWDPARLASKSRELEMKYAALYRDAPNMATEDLRRAYDDLYSADVTEISALRPVAYNDTVEETGNGEPFTLNGWQKTISGLA